MCLLSDYWKISSFVEGGLFNWEQCDTKQSNKQLETLLKREKYVLPYDIKELTQTVVISNTVIIFFLGKVTKFDGVWMHIKEVMNVES